MTISLQSHRFYTMIKVSVSTGLYILCTLILIRTYNSVFDFNIDLNYEFQSWKEPLITDIQASSTTCPTGTSKTWNYSWPGSKDSCDCRLSDRYSLSKANLEPIIYWSNCTADMVNKCSCKSSSAYPQTNVDSLFQGKETADPFVCMISNPSYNFRDSMNNTKSDGDCDDDSRLCPEQVHEDSDNIQICVKSNINCPINNLIISSNNPNIVFYKKGPSFTDD